MNYITVTCPKQFVWLIEENQLLEVGVEHGLLKVRINRFSKVAEYAVDPGWMLKALNEHRRLISDPRYPKDTQPFPAFGLEHLSLCRPAIQRLAMLFVVGEVGQSVAPAAQRGPAEPPVLPPGFVPQGPKPPQPPAP